MGRARGAWGGWALLAVAVARAALASEESGVAVELDVHPSDGGYQVGSADAGTSEALVPPALLADSPAGYPAALAQERRSGVVRLELLVGEAGEVQSVTVVDSTHEAMAAAAKAAASGLRFTPAQRGGVPVPVRIHFEYRFEPPPLPPQRARLAGVILEKGTRRPVVGAAVIPEQGAPAETDASGRFELELPPGVSWVRIASPAHKPLAFKETLERDQKLEVAYAIEPLVVNPYQTIVRAERQRTEVSRISLREQELREVPGTMGDPFRVIMLMPGVASVASGVSYPVVRGSQPAATGYFIDGVRVPMLYHLMLGPAVVHPEFIDGIDFHPGLPPSRYGRLLGGVIEGHASKPREDRLHASAYADLINAGAFVEKKFAETGTHLTLSGRFSYTPWLITAGVNLLTEPDFRGFRRYAQADFYDYQGRIEQDVGGGKLRFLLLGSSDLVGATTDDPEGFNAYLHSRFHKADLRYRAPLGAGEFEVGASVGTQSVGLNGEQGGEEVGNYVLQSNDFAARAGWSADLSSRVRLETGIDVLQQRAATDIDGATDRNELLGPGTSGPYRAPQNIATMTGAHAELQWRLSDKLLLVPGLRLDAYHLVPGQTHLAADPRLVARYALDDRWTLKAGAGMVHQAPTVLLNLPVMDVAGLKYGLQEAIQLDAGAEWRSPFGLELQADAYFHRITRAVEFTLMDVLEDRRRRGFSVSDPGMHGYAWGLELMARRPLGERWFGWISYAFQQSRRLQTFSRFDDDERPTGTRTEWLPFAFQQEHVFNAALSYRFDGNLTVGTVLHFNTGRPETGEISSRTMRPGTLAQTGEEIWVVEDRDRVKDLPPFFRVDLRVSKAWTLKDVIVEGYLDVLNVTMSREVLGFDYYKGQDEMTFDPNAPITLQRRPIHVPVIVPILGAKVVY